MNSTAEKDMQQLQSPEMQQRYEAIERLGETGNRDAIGPLIDILRHALDTWDERFLVTPAIRALGRLKAKEAVPVLLQALENSLVYVKTDAAEALGELDGDGEVLERLKRTLASDEHKEVREGVLRGLAGMRDPEAIQLLVDVVENDPDPEMKEEAIRALGRSRQLDALPALTHFYRQESNERMRIEVIQALSNIAAASSAEFLINALYDDNPEIRACAAMALGQLRSSLAERPLKVLLTDPVPHVRRSAAMALGLIIFLPD